MSRRNRRSSTTLTITVLLIAAAVFGWTHLHSGAANHTEQPAAATTASAPAAPAPAAASGSFPVTQYPSAGFAGVYAQIAAAKTSINMEMYELSDQAAEQALTAAAARGVSVRVMLDQAWHGKEANQAAYTYLSGHGVAVKWAPAGVIFHLKTTVFDNTSADVSTANLTSKYYPTGLDAMIQTTNPAQVSVIGRTFTADWAGQTTSTDTIQAPGLVWSPGAQQAMVAAISAAKHHVEFSSEELSTSAEPVVDSLAADAKRGVTCTIVMTNSKEWDAAFTTVSAVGCQVRTYPNTTKGLYVHEKQVITDPGTPDAAVLLGSQNVTSTSLNRNRELGIIVTAAQDAATVQKISAQFSTVAAGAAAAEAGAEVRWCAAPAEDAAAELCVAAG